VFDGHCGSTAVDVVTQNLYRNIFSSENMQYLTDENAIDEKIIELVHRGFAVTEDEVIQATTKENDDSGACAVTMIIAHNKLYVTNLGDCRAVLGKRDYLSLKYANRVRLLSLDHTAKEEKKRIEEAQCSIIENRIFGRCQFSRSFGDRELKSLPQDKQLSNHVSKTNSSSQPKKNDSTYF